MIKETQARSRRRIFFLRLGLIAALLAGWEAMARSGVFYHDVVPVLGDIGLALITLLSGPGFYFHLGWTVMEIVAGLAIGGVLGIVAGVLLGTHRFLGRAFDPYIYYLGSTPKLVFFPVLILLFGVGANSKIALGAISGFFPIALSTSAGLRQIEGVLVRVGRSFRANSRQMAFKIYFPAMWQPVIGGFRLGLGITTIATMLAETKLSNRGVGYLVIQAFAAFDIPRMYALLATVFALSVAANMLLTRLARTKT